MTPNPWRTPTELWWTEADLAEIDCVAYDLVDAMKTHEEHCETCRTTQVGCLAIREALEAAIVWRDRRLLRTKAETLGGEIDV